MKIERKAVTVSELVTLSNEMLQSTFPDVLVEGELAGVRFYSSGHCYFTLKDAGACISGVMWSSALRRMKFRPEDGAKVVVRGSLGIYVARGSFQIQALSMEPVGIGALALAFEQLRKKLEAEGLFAPERKRPIPMLPSVVGIVTSKSGAALQDVLRVLSRRHAGVRVVVADSRVQGEGAAAEIARAIALMNDWGVPDVLIVGRGGGSLEDLWAFNEEPVVRAVAHSKIPVISAVGHEVDWTLCDFAADRRAPTPSAAAEEVVAAREELLRRVSSAEARGAHALRGRLSRVRARWVALDRSEALAGFPARVAALRARLDRAGSRLAGAPREAAGRLRARTERAAASLHRWPATAALPEKKARIAMLEARLAAAAERRVADGRGRLGTAAGRLSALSPLAVLSRGYAIVRTRRKGEAMRALLRATDARAGDPLSIRLGEGEIDAVVTSGAPAAPRPKPRTPESPSLFDEEEPC